MIGRPAPATPAAAAEAAEAEASGSSFYAGMRLLPKAERDAMFLIYHFCRAVDDIADDADGSRAERSQALDAWRDDIAALYAGRAGALAAPLAEAVERFDLDEADFLAVIDGMQMDVDRDIRGPDLATLDLYCERVASAVGRLSVRVFGMEDEPGRRLAHHLGRALQLTNILRDLDEDATLGRLYLPRELLDEAGLGALAGARVADREPTDVLADPRVDGACRALAGRAHDHFREAEAVLSERPAGLLAAARMMDAVYAELLAKTERLGWAPPRVRARLGRREILWLLARNGLLRNGPPQGARGL